MPGKQGSKSRQTLRRRDGALCVSFANTTSEQRRAPENYAGLLAWLERHGAIDSATMKRFAGLAVDRPEAAEVFASAQRLKTLLSWIFNELADHRPLPPEMLKAFNESYIGALPGRQLVATRGGFRWDWSPGRQDDLACPLWTVILSAADLLASKYCGKILRCAGEGCDLLFVQRRGGSPRRWCDMKSCGQPVKARRYYNQKTRVKRQLWKEALNRKDPYVQEVLAMIEARKANRSADSE